MRLEPGALARTDAFRVADLVIKALVARTGRTAQIAAKGPLGPTVVRWHMGRPAVMTSFNVGAALPLLHSATDHIFLVFAPEQETETMLAREAAVAGSDATAVAAIREYARSAGRADIKGRMVPGLGAVACPIFDPQGTTLSATALTPHAFASDRDKQPSPTWGWTPWGSRRWSAAGWGTRTPPCSRSRRGSPRFRPARGR